MKDKRKLKKLALEKIKVLFKEAKKTPKMADRYVKLARELAMKVNLTMPREYKRRFCKHCYVYFDSKNRRVRVHKSMVIYSCLNCKKHMRFRIKK
ncbi:MAG: ribonuclease P [Nanoarchaeota archaeon]|nr:ribonuclease P [Nanoarchaeota archaeon]